MRKRNTIILGLSLSLALAAGTALAKDHHHGRPMVEVDLAPTPLAANAGLAGSDGRARLRIDEGEVSIEVDLHGAEIPPGTALEGWVVDAGLLGGPGTTSVSDDDEVFGTPFGNAAIDMAADNAAYALSTGVLEKEGRDRYRVRFKIANNLTPYDAVVVTLESDGNGENYDPRPGTPILAGEIVH